MPKDEWLKAKRKEVGQRIVREREYKQRSRQRKRIWTATKRRKLKPSKTDRYYGRLSYSDLKRCRPDEFPSHDDLGQLYYFSSERWKR